MYWWGQFNGLYCASDVADFSFACERIVLLEWMTKLMITVQTSGGMLCSAWQLTVLAYALAVNYQTEDSIPPWDRQIYKSPRLTSEP